jgi:hypothetical protein
LRNQEKAALIEPEAVVDTEVSAIGVEIVDLEAIGVIEVEEGLAGAVIEGLVAETPSMTEAEDDQKVMAAVKRRVTKFPALISFSHIRRLCSCSIDSCGNGVPLLAVYKNSKLLYDSRRAF